MSVPPSEDPHFGLDSQLLDDFFTEADEHVLGIRQGMLRLEPSVGKPDPDLSVVKDLFHHFHSLKGISALVGLKPAEAVCHQTEDLLRLIRDGQARVTAQGLELFMVAGQMLEQIVAAFRSHQPAPDYDPLLQDLRAQCDVWSTATVESAPANSPRPHPGPVPDVGKALGLPLWKFIFSPSSELNERGINLNSIREEISAFGEILKTTPTVKGKSNLSFEFVVSTHTPPGDLSSWRAKGVALEPADPERELAAVSAAPQIPSLEPEHNPFLAPSHIVRVDLRKLDDLVRITTEMVIHRSRLEAQLGLLNGHHRQADPSGAQEASASLGRSLKELREAVMRLRLVPVAEIFTRMPFVVRDLARHADKKVRLVVAGQDTLIDKYVLERLKDPLLHLVRNAFTHGVESPRARAEASKPEEATIELSASNVGDSVILHVRDDGPGINPDSIIQRARILGLDVPDQLDADALLRILCTSGFSTRESADLASGRGVGMSVVCATVRELGGDLSLTSTQGRGAQFTIRLPLTLAVIETLIVSAAGQTCAVPQSCVREIFHQPEAEIQNVNGIDVVPYRQGLLPVIRLKDFLHLQSAPRPTSCLLVITSERGAVGLLTDKIVGQREVVVRTLRDPLVQVPGITGATELGDGKPVLILDGAVLTSGPVRPPESHAPTPTNN